MIAKHLLGNLQLIELTVTGNYSPQNCRLVNMKKQCCNRSSNNIITYNGETKTISEFSKQYKLHITTLEKRLKNWGICDKTFLYPAKVGNNQYGKSDVICKKEERIRNS